MINVPAQYFFRHSLERSNLIFLGVRSLSKIVIRLFWLSFHDLIAHMIIICGAQVSNDNICRHFFYFFEILKLCVKRQKVGKNNKKLCLLHFICQEPYIIWFWFIIYLFYLFLSLVVFYFFPNFNIGVNSEVKE